MNKIKSIKTNSFLGINWVVCHENRGFSDYFGYPDDYTNSFKDTPENVRNLLRLIELKERYERSVPKLQLVRVTEERIEKQLN